MSLKHIIIVGAGPTGLLLALLLAKKGIRTTVLEREARETEDVRAVFYQKVSQYEFERAGILEDVRQVALNPRAAAFRDITGKKLFEMADSSQLMLLLNALTKIVQKHAQKQGNVDIKWSHAVIDVGQDENQAWVDVESSNGTERMKADYVIGCDGGQSTVRRKVFGDGTMNGFTWDHRLVATDLEYDLAAALPDLEDSNLFVDSQTPLVLFRTSKEHPNHWRFIYEGGTLGSDDELLARVDSTIKSFLPGNPEPHQYTLQRARPYHIHQRIVDRMRKGRVVLASDAAHLVCPFGALGLNGGIADIGSLYDCLAAIHDGLADDDILDMYDEVRRTKWNTIINPQSQGMLKMMYSDPADIIPNHPAYKASVAMAANPEAFKKNAPDPLALRYDFSKHFKSA